LHLLGGSFIRLELHLHDLINLLKNNCWHNFLAVAALYNTNLLTSLKFEILNVLHVNIDFFTKVNFLAVYHFVQTLVSVPEEYLVMELLIAGPIQQRHVLLVKAHIAGLAILLLVLAVDALVRHWWLFVVLTPKHEELPFFKVVFKPLVCTGHPCVQLPNKVNSLFHPLEVHLVFQDDLHELSVELICVPSSQDKW